MLYSNLYCDEDAAEILNVAPEWIDKWCKQRKLKGIRVLDRLYITEHQLERFLGMKDMVYCGNENMSRDGEPLGELAEAQLPLVALNSSIHPELCATREIPTTTRNQVNRAA
jgi:hypothetical protein